MNELTIQDHDILTVALLLPKDQQLREDLYEHISNFGELHNARALSAMHGNVLNYFKAQSALQERADHQVCLQIYDRLSAENHHQINAAIEKSKPLEKGEPLASTNSKSTLLSYLYPCAALALAVYSCMQIWP